MTIGFAQYIIGGFAAVCAFLLYYNFFGIQNVLNVPQQDVILYMLILIVFGILSIISGLFLINEK